MSRGVIYHITTNPDDLFEINADTFYGDERLFGVEYFADRSPEDAKTDIEKLVNNLKAAGFQFEQTTLKHPDGTNCTVNILVTGPGEDLSNKKQVYFLPMLNKLKTAINSMNIKTFAEDIYAPVELEHLINNKSSDAVHLDLGSGPATYTLHAFVRRILPNTRYYIDTTTVFMH